MKTVNEKDIARLVGNVTGRGELGDSLTLKSRLIGDIAEQDSMAIMNLIVTSENQFGFQRHDDEMEESNFATLGSWKDFVQLKLDIVRSADRPSSKNQHSR